MEGKSTKIDIDPPAYTAVEGAPPSYQTDASREILMGTIDDVERERRMRERVEILDRERRNRERRERGEKREREILDRERRERPLKICCKVFAIIIFISAYIGGLVGLIEYAKTLDCYNHKEMIIVEGATLLQSMNITDSFCQTHFSSNLELCQSQLVNKNIRCSENRCYLAIDKASDASHWCMWSPPKDHVVPSLKKIYVVESDKFELKCADKWQDVHGHPDGSSGFDKRCSSNNIRKDRIVGIVLYGIFVGMAVMFIIVGTAGS